MTLQLLFWILMLLWLVIGGFEARAADRMRIASLSIVFLAVVCLGWAVFGAPIK